MIESRDLELHVIGCMLVDPRTVDTAVAKLTPIDFSDPGLGWIFATARRLAARGRAFDASTATQAMRAEDAAQFDAWNATALMLEAASSIPHAEHIHSYVDELATKGIQRQLAQAGAAIHQRAQEPTEAAAIGAIINDSETDVYRVADRAHASFHEQETWIEAIARVTSELEQEAEPPIGVTPFEPLNDLLMDGFRAGQFVVIGARPGTGKTSLGLQIAMSTCSAGFSVLYASMEMSHAELVQRALVMHSGVPARKLRHTQDLTPAERGALVATASEISQWQMHVDDQPRQTISSIATAARRVKRPTHGGAGELHLVVIDYLQQVEAAKRNEPRHVQVGEISRRCKLLARELGCCVIALAQLNRQSQAGDKIREPRMSELRESGSIEQDADIVTLISNEPDPEYMELSSRAKQILEGGIGPQSVQSVPYDDPGSANPQNRPVWSHNPNDGYLTLASLIVAKHRAGPQGRVNVAWDRSRHRFVTIPAAYEQVMRDHDTHANIRAALREWAIRQVRAEVARAADERVQNREDVRNGEMFEGPRDPDWTGDDF